MKRFARLQSRQPVPGARSCLQVRTFATKPQTPLADSETADVDKPGPDDFIFDDQFQVNVDSKTIDTAVGSLPISPLLDPTWREARNRVTPKDRPDKSRFNRFQRQLYQNPYGEPYTHTYIHGVCMILMMGRSATAGHTRAVMLCHSHESPWCVPAELRSRQASGDV